MPDGNPFGANQAMPWSSQPGIGGLGLGVERYTIAGGAAIVVPVEAGDRISLRDVEGAQPCEIVAFDKSGKISDGVIGALKTADAPALVAKLSSRRPEDERFRKRMDAHKLTSGKFRSMTVFGPESAAGDVVEFTVAEDGLLALTSVGEAMSVEGGVPPTELVMFIKRANPMHEGDGWLPEPLADPVADFQIDRTTGKAYEVKKGQYVQIIDKFGRQCADFQAFSKRTIDQGRALPLDTTTTRMLQGKGYVEPGFHSKVFDQNMIPLVEVVQDSVLRHDTLGTTCHKRYYEDHGYFGHRNCADNFNGVLAPYGIESRPAWMAINLFFNTWLDDNQIHADEPWTRPGDYTLMRAQEDLVCVTSACPDDVDSANGWNPTDIHVRVYDSAEKIKRSFGFRKRTDSDLEMTKETGFHPRTSALTRDYVEYNGYWLPNSYTAYGANAEYWACREKAIIMDLTALRKFEIMGPDAEELCQICLTRNVRKLAIGEVVYSAMCYETGTMIDDGTLFRMTDTNFRWIGGSDQGGDWLREQAKKRDLNVIVKTSTDQLHNVSVQGPKSRDILKEIVWTPPHQPELAELNWFRFLVGRIGGYEGIPIMVSRTGYTGELGYEVWCHPDHAPEVWDAIMQAGEPHGVAPLGLEALDMLRIESGLIFANYEFDDQTDPYEAGIGFTVPLKSKNDDFIGRDALQKRKDNPQRKLVGLELDGDEVAGHGDCVRVGRHQVGVITSAMKSPVLSKNIALCRMAVEYAEPGTKVEVGKLDGHQKRLSATVVAFPAYDPKKEKPRS